MVELHLGHARPDGCTVDLDLDALICIVLNIPATSLRPVCVVCKSWYRAAQLAYGASVLQFIYEHTDFLHDWHNSTMACQVAATAGRIDALEFFRQKNLPLDERVCSIAA